LDAATLTPIIDTLNPQRKGSVDFVLRPVTSLSGLLPDNLVLVIGKYEGEHCKIIYYQVC